MLVRPLGRPAASGDMDKPQCERGGGSRVGGSLGMSWAGSPLSGEREWQTGYAFLNHSLLRGRPDLNLRHIASSRRHRLGRGGSCWVPRTERSLCSEPISPTTENPTFSALRPPGEERRELFSHENVKWCKKLLMPYFPLMPGAWAHVVGISIIAGSQRCSRGVVTP